MPRKAYLLKKDSESNGTSCRGGVGSDDPYYSDYSLEIGQMCSCDPEMLALAAHVDEVKELLNLLVIADKSPLAKMVLKSWDKLTSELKDSLSQF